MRSIQLTILLMITSLVVILISPAYAYELVLKNSYISSSDSVLLKHIADVVDDDWHRPELYELGNIEICKSPRAGFEREINKAFVIMKIKQQKHDISQIDFEGARYITIMRDDIKIEIQQQQAELNAWIASQLSMREDVFKVEFKRPLDEILVPRGIVEFTFIGSTQTLMRKNVGVYMEVYSDGKLAKRAAVNFRLKILTPVVVAQKTISKGSIISREDVAVAQKFIYADEIESLVSIKTVVGATSVKDVWQHQIISQSDVSNEDLVERGEVIKCLIADKNMTMSVTVQACESGAMGDTIRLLNYATNKTVKGVVIGKGAVELMI